MMDASMTRGVTVACYTCRVSVASGFGDGGAKSLAATRSTARSLRAPLRVAAPRDASLVVLLRREMLALVGDRACGDQHQLVGRDVLLRRRLHVVGRHGVDSLREGLQ